MVERRREKSRLSGHFYPQLAFSESGIDPLSAPNWHSLRENEKEGDSREKEEGGSAPLRIPPLRDELVLGNGLARVSAARLVSLASHLVECQLSQPNDYCSSFSTAT